MQWPLLPAVKSEPEGGEAVAKTQVKSEAVEHHMTAGNIVATCVSSDNTWSDL